MRILFINENIGGHATVHKHLERALRAQAEIEPEFLHAPERGFWRRLAGASIPLLGRLDADLQPLRAQLALSLGIRRRLGASVAGFDAVHVYTHNAALLSIGLLRSLPSVITLDATNAQNSLLLPYRRPTRWTHRAQPLTRYFEQRVYDAATLIVPNSEWAAESLISDYGVSRDKIRIVPFGPAAPDSVRRARSGSRFPRIVFVGNSMERKGGNRLLRVHAEQLRDLCLLTVVTPEQVPPAPGVEVVGDVRPGDGRLLEILRDSDVFVFPSEIDMWSNAVMEAMGAGLPVVAFRVNALPEMVPPGTGLLVEPGDDAALAAAIRRLLENPAEAAAMGAAARKLTLARHEIGVTVASLTQVFREAIARHRSTAPASASR